MPKGIVAAGDPRTVRAALEILEEGGNAFDALCAALLVAPLSEPMLTSLGGGGFLTAFSEGESRLYDFFVDVPPDRAETPDFFPIYVDFGTAVQEFHIGAASTAVPGLVAGIEAIHSDLGRLPMERIVAPAVRHARKGIVLSPLQASFVRLLEPILRSTPESAALFAPGGKLIDTETPYLNPDYAEFLERFAREGAECFYTGEIARAIDRFYRERGGSLRYEDLSSYRVHRRTPLTFDYRGYRCVTNPPPSAGGILITFTLRLLDEKPIDLHDPDGVIRFVEALAITGEFRSSHVDPRIHDPSLARILEDPRLMEHYRMGYRSRLNLWGNTTHISVYDAEGNAAAATTTNGEGSGIVVPGCGIMMNNMLGEEDLNPHGFFQWEAGVRLPSMMAPTIVLQRRRPHLVLGSAGSNRIRSAIVQTLLRHLGMEQPIDEAIAAPRIHFEKGEVFLEPGFDPEVAKRLNRRYKTTLFDEKSLFFGGVNAVTSRFAAGADPRRGGATGVAS
ncbi:gamma-glutamyltransferase family protein [Nitratifractor sp.]